MPGLTAGLNIGLSGLTAAQSALDVIGHNITNVNTPGYSRELPQLSTNSPLNFGNQLYGSGVNLAGIQGVRDSLLNLQITSATAQQYGAQARYQGLQAVASVFDDDGTTGISSQFTAFFTAMQKVAAQPEDTSLRSNLVGNAQNLLATMKTKYQTLQSAQTNADQQVGTLCSQVNALTKQIAALNKKLAGEANPDQDNDAIDQRQALADQLAQAVGVQVYVDGKNQMNVTLDGGVAPLVVGATSFDLVTSVTSASNPPFKGIAVASNPTVDISGSLQNGQLGAQLDLRDNLLPSYMQKLDQVAAGLAYNVNTLNYNGYALDGSQPHLDFFVNRQDPAEATPGTSMSNHLPSAPGLAVPPPSTAKDYVGMLNYLTVNSQIVADPSKFAASATGAAGDNGVASAMVALQSKLNTVDLTGGGPGAGSSGTFTNVISGLVTQVGTDAAGWKTTSTTQENITTALTTQRASISAVDLDTEAASLITFQRGYQASARFVTVISQLTDQLINNFGR